MYLAERLSFHWVFHVVEEYTLRAQRKVSSCASFPFPLRIFSAVLYKIEINTNIIASLFAKLEQRGALVSIDICFSPCSLSQKNNQFHTYYKRNHKHYVFSCQSVNLNLENKIKVTKRITSLDGFDLYNCNSTLGRAASTRNQT